MVDNQFDTLGDLLEFEETDTPDSDSLYEPQEIKDVARRLTFVLFEEIVESSPAQSRDVIFDPEKYPKDRELLDSVRKQGIVEPIVVRRIGDDPEPDDLFSGKKQGERTFAIVVGHRRVAAGRAAGLNGTEGVIAKPGEDHELITLAENLGRRELTSYEKARALKTLQERHDLSGRQVAEETGISKTYVNELFVALKSPEVLKKMWQEDDLSPRAIVNLGDHWPLFREGKIGHLKKHLRGLTQRDSSDLREQLDAGTDLQTALAAMEDFNKSFQSQSPSEGQPKPLGNNLKQPKPPASNKDPDKRPSTGDRGTFSSGQKEAVTTAIGDVFPGIEESQSEALFDHAIVNSVKDVEVVWAAALYIAKGGKLDQAIGLASEALGKRKIKSLLGREVKQMKRAASSLNKLGRKDKEIKAFIQTIFFGS